MIGGTKETKFCAGVAYGIVENAQKAFVVYVLLDVTLFDAFDLLVRHVSTARQKVHF